MWAGILTVIFLSAIALMVSYLLLRQSKPPLPLAPTPEEVKIHEVAQTSRGELVKATEIQIKAIEAMDHDALRDTLRNRDHGDN